MDSAYGSLRAKVIYAEFYHNGTLAHLALWPGERLELPDAHRTYPIRNGVAFYPNGQLQSLEPAEPLHVPTAIGELEAYDAHSTGMIGNRNSLAFDELGHVSALVSMADTLHITERDGRTLQLGARWEPSICSDSALEQSGLALGFRGTTLTCHAPLACQFDLLKVQVRVERSARPGKSAVPTAGCHPLS